MNDRRKITIILPSFNDIRIKGSIKSIKEFDDCNSVKIIVVDGGSREDVLKCISSQLGENDVLISEPDRGIFDALNKGLRMADTPIIGWLGADDRFSGEVFSSEVLKELEDYDLFVGSTAIIDRSGRVKRITSGLPSRFPFLVRLGLHNPHYSTFGRAAILKKYAFSLDYPSSDIGYFAEVFSSGVSVSVSERIFVYQAEGGFSNSSVRRILLNNFFLYRVYGGLFFFSVTLKLITKLFSALKFRIFPRYIDSEFIG